MGVWRAQPQEAKGALYVLGLNFFFFVEQFYAQFVCVCV